MRRRALALRCDSRGDQTSVNAVPSFCTRRSIANAVCAVALLFAACAVDLPTAVARERVGDAIHAVELERHARAASTLEHEWLEWSDDAPAAERFGLYRVSNQLTGTWSQVEFLQSLLELSTGVESITLESDFRATLRAQAQFVLCQIDETEHLLAQDAIPTVWHPHLQMTTAIRTFFSQVADTVARLLADEQARPTDSSDSPP